MISTPVDLCPKAVDGRPFSQIQHPALDGVPVGGNAHDAAQSVYFPNQMTLRRTADGRVAGKVGDSIQRQGKEDGRGSQTGSGHCSFHTGVAGSDHRHVIATQSISHILLLLSYTESRKDLIHYSVRDPFAGQLQ